MMGETIGHRRGVGSCRRCDVKEIGVARRSMLLLILVVAGIVGACTNPSTGGGATNAPAAGSAAPAPGSAAPASAEPTKAGY
jgi:hypothetical protein